MERPDPVQIQRAIGLRGSLHSFVRMAWPHVEPGEEFVDSWHVEEMCAHLEAVFRGEISKLAITIPPGMMKSLTTSVFWPAWCWIRNPSLRFIAASYDASLSGKRDGGKVLDLIHSDWFKARWGDRVMVANDAAASDFKTSAGGFRFGTSIGGKLMGRHGHFLVLDDPLKPADISKLTLEEVQQWRTQTAPTRLLPGGGQVYIMQRLHEDDPVGHAQEEPGWEFLRLPMRYEAHAPCKTSVGGDRRTVDGELLCPERFNEATVKERERALGARNTAAQFQQRPAPESGVIFQREWFKQYDVAPAKFDQLLMSVDATFKDAETSDFVAIQVWGKRGGEFFLLDQVHERLDFPATLEAIRACKRKWKRASPILIEDKANGPAIIATLSKELSGIVAINPEGGKEARANAAAPLFEAGNVYHPDPAKVEWVDLHRAELLGFPFAKHDDTVDACTQALNYFRVRSNRFLEAMRKAKARGMVAATS